MECNHSLISDLAVMAEGSVLMVTYSDLAKYDGESGWFLPDDVLGEFEHPVRAAKRIAKEQLGIEPDRVDLDHVESFRGNDGGWHLSFHNLAALPTIPEVQLGAGVAEARWFTLDGLPPRAEVAHHGWALTTLKRMTTPGDG